MGCGGFAGLDVCPEIWDLTATPSLGFKSIFVNEASGVCGRSQRRGTWLGWKSLCSDALETQQQDCPSILTCEQTMIGGEGTG